MFISEISVPVSRIKGAGKTAENLLASLGVHTVGDLLSYWPRAWEDRTEFHTLKLAGTRAKLQLRCTVAAHAWTGFARTRTLKLIVKDEYGEKAALVCFNRPFLESQFPVGSRCIVYGAFSWRYGEMQSSNFEIEREDATTRKSNILPVYPLTEGLTQNRLRKLISTALSQYARGIDSELSAEIRGQHGIPSKQEVLFLMHAPKSMKETEEGKRAVIFEEFFFFEYALGKRSIERRGKLPEYRQKDEAAMAAEAPDFESLPLQKAVIDRLPFSLTAGQSRAVGEINADMANTVPMARLLQGDVGSGKTLVSFLAAAGAVQSSRQCALIVPTELLARQHAETAAKYLEPAGIRIAFLTSNLKAAGRGLLLRELKEGNIDFIIGTHALFSRDVEYKNLALAIVDEQHRFGVLQRAALIEKGRQSSPEGKAPHLLMMSATPIPRTLALSVFGDLDISTIRESPPGRKPVKTHLVRKGNEARLYDFLSKEISAGRQVYVVCPLIAEGQGAADIISAEETYEELKSRVFPGIPIALIHSKVEAEGQRKIMEGFKAGDVKILVATSVIEVGVDVSNATCMVIEHAERFGLATLHQLRGRVGRGDLQSYCFLVYDSRLTDEGKARLMVMKETTDGFRIAEEDLKIRGPGEIAGVQQSGYAAFKYADPIRDAAILEEARGAAFALAEGEISS